MIRLSRVALATAIILAFSMGCDKQGPPTINPKATEDIRATPAISENSSPTTNPSDADRDPERAPTLEVESPDHMNWLTREQISDGWIRLFDGHTLFGWKSNGKLGWSVRDGVIAPDSRDAADNGLLVSTTRFADYELRCDVRVEKGGNSGLFLRTAINPKDPTVDCYELNMCDAKPNFATASLVGRMNPTKQVRGDGAWHSYSVRLEGPRVTAKFDGDEVLDYTDTNEPPLTTGFIGLQMNGGQAEFRNVYLKPLGMRPIFDGNSLIGWRVIPGSQSDFTVKDGTIHVVNGRGFLETETTAADFVLQFEAITNGDRLNSGVFFRALPGTAEAPSNGYEFQIQNGFKDNDRNQPDDFGTGAIFRRIPARRVVSNDHQWLAATLIADGPHFSTWVDGIQVVDWTDERPDHLNPREGRRLSAGHFSLQGHDPTTDLDFRNLRLVETPQ